MKNKFYKNIPVRKRFGQNFLLNENVINQIVEKADISSEDFVLEIGPGHGVLTRKLVETAGKVTAVEIDRDLFASLKNKFSDVRNLELINQDILDLELEKIDYDDFLPENRKVIGNIPYYITTPIIMKFINEKSLKKYGICKTNMFFSEIIIMLQKEVGLRLLAKPGTKDYGSLSVIVQYACEVKPLLNVSSGNFFPRPKVDSMVVSLKLKNNDDFIINNHEMLWRIVHSVFVSRRKTLRNSLKLCDFHDEDLNKIQNNFDLTIRGETLSLEEFVKLTNLLSAD